MSTLKDLLPVLAVRAGLLSRLALLQRESPIDTRHHEVQKVRDELDRFDNTELEQLIKEHKHE